MSEVIDKCVLQITSLDSSASGTVTISSDNSISTLTGDNRFEVLSALDILLDPVNFLLLWDTTTRQPEINKKKTASSEDILTPRGQLYKRSTVCSVDVLNDCCTPSSEQIDAAKKLWIQITEYVLSHIQAGKRRPSLRIYSYSQCFFGSEVCTILGYFFQEMMNQPLEAEKIKILCIRLLQTGVLQDIKSGHMMFKESRLYRLNSGYNFADSMDSFHYSQVTTTGSDFTRSHFVSCKQTMKAMTVMFRTWRRRLQHRTQETEKQGVKPLHYSSLRHNSCPHPTASNIKYHFQHRSSVNGSFTSDQQPLYSPAMNTSAKQSVTNPLVRHHRYSPPSEDSGVYRSASFSTLSSFQHGVNNHTRNGHWIVYGFV